MDLQSATKLHRIDFGELFHKVRQVVGIVCKSPNGGCYGVVGR